MTYNMKITKKFIAAMKTNPMAFVIGFILFTICGSVLNKFAHQIYVGITQ